MQLRFPRLREEAVLSIVLALQTLTALSIDAITSQLEALIPNRLHPKPHMVCIPRIEVSFVQVMGEVEVAQQVRGFGDIGSTGGDYYTATTAG